MKKISLILIMTSIILVGQQTYQIPFASTNNTFELTVENPGMMIMKNVNVSVDAPDWIRFDKELVNIAALASYTEFDVMFAFDIDKSAPVNESAEVIFTIDTDRGIWQKDISLSVLPPAELKLEQNYPNPFNPATTLEYQLPEKSKVDISVYNMLGQFVEQLESGIKEPGFHKVEWNASNYASGVYIYQLYVQGSKDKLIRKKMLLVK